MSEEARKLLTIEDWMGLDDDARMEIVEGEFVRRALPSLDHSFGQQSVSAQVDLVNRVGGRAAAARKAGGSPRRPTSFTKADPTASFTTWRVGASRRRHSARAARRPRSGPTGSARSCRRIARTTSCASTACCTSMVSATTGLSTCVIACSPYFVTSKVVTSLRRRLCLAKKSGWNPSFRSKSTRILCSGSKTLRRNCIVNVLG